MTPIQPCNLCGEPCGLVVDHGGTPYTEHMGLFAEVTGGYESTPGNGQGALDDCTTYRFAICEFCLDWLFTQFKIPPQVSWMDGTLDPFRPATQRVEEDDWRRMKDEFRIEAARRALLRGTLKP